MSVNIDLSRPKVEKPDFGDKIIRWSDVQQLWDHVLGSPADYTGGLAHRIDVFGDQLRQNLRSGAIKAYAEPGKNPQEFKPFLKFMAKDGQKVSGAIGGSETYFRAQDVVELAFASGLAVGLYGWEKTYRADLFGTLKKALADAPDYAGWVRDGDLKQFNLRPAKKPDAKRAARFSFGH